VAEPLLGPPEFGFEVIEALAAKVLHLYVLEVIPDALIRVQIRGVAWQLLQVETPGGSLPEKLTDRFSPVGWKPASGSLAFPKPLAERGEGIGLPPRH